MHPQLGTSPHMVRWMSGLVNGLQNRVHPFESGTHLQQKDSTVQVEPFFVCLIFVCGDGGAKKTMKGSKPYLHKMKKHNRSCAILWRWRGLNPRPNKEAIRFLHAYSCLWFS